MAVPYALTHTHTHTHTSPQSIESTKTVMQPPKWRHGGHAPTPLSWSIPPSWRWSHLIRRSISLMYLTSQRKDRGGRKEGKNGGCWLVVCETRGKCAHERAHVHR